MHVFNVVYNHWLYFQTEILDQLPPDVIDQLPDDVVEQLRDGTLDQIPEEVIKRLPESVQDRIPASVIDFASSNPMWALLGVLGVAGFVYGLVKSLVKLAFVAGVLAAIAWYFFFFQKS